MSLFDTIKSFFSKKSAEKPELKQQNKVSDLVNKAVVEKQVERVPETKPEPVAEAKPELITESVAEIQKPVLSDTVEKVKVAAVTEVKEKQPQIPEDSTLRRHYLANLQAEKEHKITETADKKVAPVVTVKPELVASPLSEIKAEPAPLIKKTPTATATKEKITLLQIPEDATLKRHYLSNLKAEIESGIPPRPTDSTLKRHYDATVQAELENLLAKATKERTRNNLGS